MAIVCGKCGSVNIYATQGMTEYGETGRSLSCLKCGNTSESKKYGFHYGAGNDPKEKKDTIMTPSRKEGTCKNCEREKMMVSVSTGLCGSCAEAIRGIPSDDVDERSSALAAARGKFYGQERRGTGRGRKFGPTYPEMQHHKVIVCRICGRERTNQGYNLCATCRKSLEGFTKIQIQKLLARLTKKGVHFPKVEGKPGIQPQSGAGTLPGHLDPKAKVEGKPEIGCTEENMFPPLSASFPDTTNTVTIEGQTVISVILPIVTDADLALLAAIEKQAQRYRRTLEQQILWICQNEIEDQEGLLKEAGCNHGI